MRCVLYLPLIAGLAFPSIVEAQTSPSPIVSANRPDQHPAQPAPAAPPRLGAPDAKAPSAAFSPFRLKEVRVDGASVSAKLFRQAYEPFLGRTVSAQDLSDITTRVANVYASKTDIALYTVQIPQQIPTGGVLRLEVVEGYIEKAQIKGPPGQNYGLLKRYLQRLVRERPLRRSTLERQVSLIRDLPGLNPAISFVDGSKPGVLQLLVVAKPHKAEIGFGVNNRGTAFLGRTQAELDLHLHSLLREGDDTTLTVAAPTEVQKFQYYGLTQAQPIGAGGAVAQITFGYLRTRPSFADLTGHAVSLGGQLNLPLLRSYQQNIYATLGVDGLNSDNALLGETISDDRTRAFRTALTYSRQTSRMTLIANGSVSFGLDGLGARVLYPQISDITFRKYNAKVGLNVALVGDTVLRLDSAVQYTSDRLPAAEQFALGGEEFGRAYEAAVIAGDSGYAGSAEVAWKVDRVVPHVFNGSEVYGFVDAGQTHDLGRFGEASYTQTVASIGDGVRAAVGSRVVVQVEATRGLTNPVETENHKVWRAVFSVRSLF